MCIHVRKCQSSEHVTRNTYGEPKYKNRKGTHNEVVSKYGLGLHNMQTKCAQRYTVNGQVIINTWFKEKPRHLWT